MAAPRSFAASRDAARTYQGASGQVHGEEHVRRRGGRRPMNPRVSATLVVLSEDLQHDQVTQVLGAEPTTTWRKGDLVSARTTHRRQRDGWAMAAREPDSADLEAHVRAVLDRLQPREGFQPPPSWAVLVSCVVWIGDWAPPVFLSRAVVARLAALGAALDVDIYPGDLGSEAAPDAQPPR